MATIRKRGKRWEAQVRIKGHPSQSQSFASRLEAVRWSREVEAARSEKLLADPTISELLARYERELTTLKRGAEQERYKIAILSRSSLAAFSISTLQAEHIAEYRDYRLRLVSGSTVRRELAILRHCLEVSRKEWGYSSIVNLVDQIRVPAPGRARDVRLSPTQLATLWQAIGHSKAWYLRPIVIVAIETGMRRGELLALKWCLLDHISRVAHLPLTKNGTARTVPLSPVANECLLQLTKRDPELVFPVSKHALRQAWEKVTVKANLKGFRFHDLRHEALSRLFELGLSIAEVQLIGGHKTVSQLMRYVHPRPYQVAEKLNKLSRVVARSSL